jgi:adenylate cyclase
MVKKIILSPWTAILTLAVVLILRAADPSFVESVRLRYFDTLITSKPLIENNIVVANIDETALEKYGQWPFKRDVYASIIEDLYHKGAGLVVWDIMMPEKDRLGGDDTLSAVLSKYPVVLANVPSNIDKNHPKPPGASVINSQWSNKILNYSGIIANIPELENLAAGIGTTNTLPEIDGVNRRMPLLISSKDKLYPSMPIEVLRVAAGDKSFQVKLSELGIDKLRIPKFGPISTDALGRIWIDLSQRSKEVSVTSLPQDLHGDIVIVGVSAAGVANPVPTAIGAIWPQTLQAAVVGTLMNKVNIVRPNYADGAELIILLISGILVIFVSRWTWAFIPVLGILIGSHFLAKWGYDSYRYLFDITAFIFGISLVYIHAYTVKFVSEFLQKQQIKKQFEHYLAPAMVKKLQANPNILKLGGDTRELTLLFCDIRGFTPISEQYKTNPQGLTALINRFLTPMTDIIMKNEGTIDKYMGDCIMAFWNAPLDVEHQQEMAVKSAVEMLSHLKSLNQELAKDNLLPINIGIGINTGEVVVGNMGSSQRFDYSCLGDAVNLAARLEGQSKDYGVKIVLGYNTVSALSNDFITVELDTIAVKGKTEGVRIFTLIDQQLIGKSQHLNSAINQHQKFLESYRDQRWDRATILARSLSTAWNYQLKDYYHMMIKRCETLKESPPGLDWDGVFRAQTK